MKPNDVLGFANSRPQLFGSALHDFMKRASRGLARIGCRRRSFRAENRVVLPTARTPTASRSRA